MYIFAKPHRGLLDDRPFEVAQQLGGKEPRGTVDDTQLMEAPWAPSLLQTVALAAAQKGPWQVLCEQGVKLTCLHTLPIPCTNHLSTYFA